MEKVLRCDCGFEVHADDEAKFVAEVRRHALREHGMQLSPEEVLQLVFRNELGAGHGSSGWEMKPVRTPRDDRRNYRRSGGRGGCFGWFRLFSEKSSSVSGGTPGSAATYASGQPDSNTMSVPSEEGTPIDYDALLQGSDNQQT